MKKKRKAWIWILVIVLLLAAGGGAYYWFYLRGGDEDGAAYVQNVAELTGMGTVGRSAVYNGIVEAKDVIEINPESDLRIRERFVETGSKVKEGDPLFEYDVEDLKLSHAQLLIDITGLENKLRTSREELESLNKKLEKAKENAIYELTLQIQTLELDIRKAEYDLNDKQQKAADMQVLIDASVVFSPVSGTVRSVRDDTQSDPFGYGDSTSNAYISIVAGTDYCIKGTVSELAVYTLYEGMPVLVRSRVSDAVYPGTIYKINTDSTASDSQRYYYDAGGDSASKYYFYVEPETIEGLLIGQHVLIDLNTASEEDSTPMLPAAFVMEEGGRFYVWAANAKNRIEKREIQLGAYDEIAECYPLLSGLKLTDRIAYPDDTVKAGMLATETAYIDPGMGGDFGFENSTDFGTEDGMDFDTGFGMENGMDFGTDDGIFFAPEDGAFDEGVTEPALEPEPAPVIGG